MVLTAYLQLIAIWDYLSRNSGKIEIEGEMGA
jgi:hypothetical protein